MANVQDHSDETLVVYLSKTRPGSWWCPQYGDVQIPQGWDLLPPGDPFVTRKVKEKGAYWLAKKPGRQYARTLGVWTPAENIEAAQDLAQHTKAAREAKRVVSRTQREREEAKYRERFAGEVYNYLSFSPQHEALAQDIATAVAQHAGDVGSGRVGRTKKLSLREKAELAARAHIRHNYTNYDERLAESVIALDEGDFAYRQIRAEAQSAVDEFLDEHRKRAS
jgi:hypothetical protein